MPRLHCILFWLHKLCRICVARVAPGAALVWLGECEARWYFAKALAFAAFNIFNQGWLLSVSFGVYCVVLTWFVWEYSIIIEYKHLSKVFYICLFTDYVFEFIAAEIRKIPDPTAKETPSPKLSPKLWKDGPHLQPIFRSVVSILHSAARITSPNSPDISWYILMSTIFFKYYQYGTSKCTCPILPAGSRLGGTGFRVPKSFEMSVKFLVAGFVLRSWIKPRWDIWAPWPQLARSHGFCTLLVIMNWFTHPCWWLKQRQNSQFRWSNYKDTVAHLKSPWLLLGSNPPCGQYPATPIAGCFINMFFLWKRPWKWMIWGVTYPHYPPFEWPKTARTSAELCFDQLCAWPTATVVWG